MLPWDNIKAEESDEIDRMMLDEIKNNPDCNSFVSAETAYKELGLE